MAWANKYRPTRFEDVLGNQYLRSKLARMVELGNLPQALMFTGERGTGKTSLARILAATMQCVDVHEGERCSGCEQCHQLSEDFILKGKNPQGIPIYEIDVTKFNKREDIAKIVERIQQRLLQNHRTIYILDEMQRASPEAQSCFLKILEEPQPNVYVFLCTTDKEKLIVPLRSRFHEVVVHPPTTVELSMRAEHICRQEGVNYEVNAIQLVIAKYQHIPREVLNKLEFVSLTGAITRAAVHAELNLAQEKYYTAFFKACFTGGMFPIMQLIEEMRNEPQLNFNQFTRGIGLFLTGSLKMRAGIAAEGYLSEEIRQIKQVGGWFTTAQIAKVLQLIDTAVDPSHEMSEFMLTSLALQISELVAPAPQSPVEGVEVPVEQAYREVSDAVMESHARTIQTPTESVTTEQFLAIFGTENVGTVVPTNNE